MRRGVRLWGPLLAGFSALGLLAGRPAAAQARTDGLRLQVVETARSVDLAKGRREPFLTLTVEVSGVEPGRLRRVQPFREDFRVLAGKASLPCRWLRGGSLPDDPGRLRFVLGFSTPPRGVRTVSLLANLPRLESETALELRLADLKPGYTGQERRGEGWQLTVESFAEKPYLAPSLPSSGQYMSKGGPADIRVFRKPEGEASPPDRALTLSFFSPSVGLFDPTLDVTAQLLVEGGPASPLLAAVLKRDPSRSVKNPPYGPFVRGELHFALPTRGRATGVMVRLHRRPAEPKPRPVQIDGLPVPGD